MRSHSEAFRELARVWRERRAERVRGHGSQRCDHADPRPAFPATFTVQQGAYQLC
ncbi:hypothetical protein ACWIGW_41905 [Nocardia brasiliensis]